MQNPHSTHAFKQHVLQTIHAKKTTTVTSKNNYNPCPKNSKRACSKDNWNHNKEDSHLMSVK
jgi:hypothetical protein